MLWLSAALAEVPQCVELSDPYPTRRAERVGLGRNAAYLALRGWQLVIGPADGAGCTMYPSCSRYAMFAVAQEGVIRGTFMAAARLTRHHKDPDYSRCKVGDRTYVYAPVEGDTWWD